MRKIFQVPSLFLAFFFLLVQMASPQALRPSADTGLIALDKTDASENKSVTDQHTSATKASGNLTIPTAADWGEDLSSIKVPGTVGSRVPLMDAFQIEEAKYPKFTRELIRVQWRPLDPVELMVIKPVGVAKPPVALYLFSYPSDTDRYINTEFCNSLTANGVAAVGFVSALTGHRYHERPNNEWFVSQLQESLATSVHDVQFILDYLSARGDLDMNRVGMWGDGSGASIAIMAAAADSRIKTLDLLDPWGDWPDWLSSSTLVPDNERAAYLKPDFLKKIETLDPVKWLPELSSRPIRLQFIEGVRVTPLAAQNSMVAVAKDKVQVSRYESLKTFLSAERAPGKHFEWLHQQITVLQANQGTTTASDHGSR